MRLITENEFAQMERLLANLLETIDSNSTWASAEHERLQILQLHSRLQKIFKKQSALREAENRLKRMAEPQS